jgi:hypothetical protein
VRAPSKNYACAWAERGQLRLAVHGGDVACARCRRAAVISVRTNHVQMSRPKLDAAHDATRVNDKQPVVDAWWNQLEWIQRSAGFKDVSGVGHLKPAFLVFKMATGCVRFLPSNF